MTTDELVDLYERYQHAKLMPCAHRYLAEYLEALNERSLGNPKENHALQS